MRMFPLFISLQEKSVVVFGAGKIAQRRIGTLLQFGCHITVIAPEATEQIRQLAAAGKIRLQCRKYCEEDCKGADMVIAATNCREVNHAIYLTCKALGCHVNVIDCKEECSFYFPAVISEGSSVIGITASGESHKRAKQMADHVRALKEQIFSTEE